MRSPSAATEMWRRLEDARSPAPLPIFDDATLAELPPPAARWLGRVLPPATPLHDCALIDMHGEIRIGSRWYRFTAEQILRAGVGFVWRATVGGRILRFVGADLLGPDDARLEFRLHGLIPVARESGPDVARSAAGRLAAETVAWLPTCCTPQAGAGWSPVDDEHAVVALEAAGETVDVEVSVATDGRLRSVRLRRWNASADPPDLQWFGADVDRELTTGAGTTIAGSAAVGWGHGTPEWSSGEFFRYIVDAHRPVPDER